MPDPTRTIVFTREDLVNTPTEPGEPEGPDTTYAAIVRYDTGHRRVDDKEFFSIPAAVRHGRDVADTDHFLVAVIGGDELIRIADHGGGEIAHTPGELRAIAEQIGLAGVKDDPDRATRRGFPGYSAPRRDPGRRATITITPDLIAMMLHLPEGVRIIHAGYDHEQDVIRLAVEGGPLPGLDPEMTACRIGTADATVYQLDHGGHLWHRAEWSFPWREGTTEAGPA